MEMNKDNPRREMSIKEAEEVVDIFLKSNPYESLPKNERTYLIRSAIACSKRAEALRYANKIIDDNTISLKAMVEDGVCSSGTIMHAKSHPALRDFVNQQAQMYNVATKASLSEPLQVELNELRRKVEIIVDKDAVLLEAQATIQDLKNELKQKEAVYQQQIKDLNKQLKSKKIKNIKDADFKDASYVSVPELPEE